MSISHLIVKMMSKGLGCLFAKCSYFVLSFHMCSQAYSKCQRKLCYNDSDMDPSLHNMGQSEK